MTVTFWSAISVILNKPQYLPRVSALADAYPNTGGDLDGRKGILATVFRDRGTGDLYDVYPGAKIGGELCT